MDTVLNKVKRLCTDILILFKEVDTLLTTPLHSPQTRMSCSWAYARGKAHVKNKLLHFVKHAFEKKFIYSMAGGMLDYSKGEGQKLFTCGILQKFRSIVCKKKNYSQNLLGLVFNAR